MLLLRARGSDAVAGMLKPEDFQIKSRRIRLPRSQRWAHKGKWAEGQTDIPNENEGMLIVRQENHPDPVLMMSFHEIAAMDLGKFRRITLELLSQKFPPKDFDRPGLTVRLREIHTQAVEAFGAL